MVVVAHMDKCDRFCREFNLEAGQKLSIKHKDMKTGSLGFDAERAVVVFYQRLVDKEHKEHLLMHPGVIFDPARTTDEEVSLVALRLGLKYGDVKKRFKKAKLL